MENNDIWTFIGRELVSISKDAYHEDLEDIVIVVGYIIMQGEMYNKDYFRSDKFLEHCVSLRLVPSAVLLMVKYMWKLEGWE
jgi:hypothetical protein